jgi:fluoroquinolone transport system permease protein
MTAGGLRRLRATLLLDAKVQAKSQLYTIGLAVAVLLGGMLRFLVPVAYIGRGFAGFVLTGLGGTTFMFGAAMLLLERDAGVLAALRVTPLTTRDYVLSKTLTLTSFALVETAVVYAIAARGVPTSFPWLLLGAVVLGVFYTLVGLGLAAGYDVITRFLLPMGTTVAMVLQLPFLSLFGIGDWWMWAAVPSTAPMLLIQGAFEPLSTGQTVYALGMSVAMLAGAWTFCRRRFAVHVGLADA